MPTYKELLAQREALNNQIDQARQSELSDALAKVRAMIEEFGLTQADIFGQSRKSTRTQQTTGRKVAAKYRNPETGDTWTGRGRQPRWIQGKNLSDYLID